MSAAYAAANELAHAAREAHGRAIAAASSLGLLARDVDAFHALTNECLRWRNDGEQLLRESEIALSTGRRLELAEQAIAAFALGLQKARDAHKLALASADGLAPASEEEQSDAQAAEAEASAAANAEAEARYEAESHGGAA